ncbi:MAG: hypothetical protein P4N41_19165 [Negativicutes bacterium]|nr:hypothetical protein [Negativicutes bacterium]
MINREQLIALIKSHVPNASEKVTSSIANDITQDIESIIHSMVRQAASQTREDLYLKNTKEA